MEAALREAWNQSLHVNLGGSLLLEKSFIVAGRARLCHTDRQILLCTALPCIDKAICAQCFGPGLLALPDMQADAKSSPVRWSF